MSNGYDGQPDASSIQPVSSLRSQFESLRKDSPVPSKPIPPSKPQTLKVNSRLEAATNLPPPRSSLDVPVPRSGSLSATDRDGIQRPLTPSTRRRAPSPPKPRSRPTSMVIGSSSPRRTPKASPPRVHVQSPKSPPKPVNVPKFSTANQEASMTPSLRLQTSQESGKSHSVSPHRMHVVRGASLSDISRSLDLPLPDRRRELSASGSDTESRGRIGPPPINRSAKPRSSREFDQTHTSTSSPGSPMIAQNRKVSPFNTPPGSSGSSPAESPEESPSPPQLPMNSKPQGFLTGLPPNNQFTDPATRHTVRHKNDGADFYSSEGLRSQASKVEEEAPALPPRRVPQSSVAGEQAPVKGLLSTSKPSALTMGFAAKPNSSNPVGRAPQPLLSVPSSQQIRQPASPVRPVLERHLSAPPGKMNNEIPGAGYADHEIVDLAPNINPSEYPDSSKANRRPPHLMGIPQSISVGYETRLVTVCGEFICTTGTVTRVYSILNGKLILSTPHAEHIKVTAVCFRPTRNVEEDGQRIWLGTNWGEIHELDVTSKKFLGSNVEAHSRREILKLYKHGSDIWSLDEEGKLYVWPADADGAPSVSRFVPNGRSARRPTASVVVGDELWLAFGKDIRVIKPDAYNEILGQQSSPQQKVISTSNDMNSATVISDQPERVYFGRNDGKVAVFSTRDYSCLELVSVSLHRMAYLSGVGSYLWTGHSIGTVIVYDTSTKPWTVKKDWRAHETPVAVISSDRDSLWKLGQLPVITHGSASLHIWDGLLEDDWIDDEMNTYESKYCDFGSISALVMTWNVGASTPSDLRYDEKDSNFFRDLLSAEEPPGILVFGLQELVDLEDKKLTAKSFFKSKQRDVYGQEHLGSVYRAWRDYFSDCLDHYMPVDQSYTLLHTASLVGLFTCIFVKVPLRKRIKDVQASEVKTGMGGLHGNKGAIVIRIILDDSSICFVNCHLAAGQSHTSNRNNDIASILETSPLPSIRTASYQHEMFVGGGDGSMILDSETCILNGDLNYRIDTFSRDAAISAVKQGNLAKLLERDQLLALQRKNPAFRLRWFHEGQIKFAPTYKYDVGTDTYDTSEKRRIPAWCDRILYRGRVKQHRYGRHEIRVSDHRPVSSRFTIEVKTIQQDKRAECLKAAEQKFAKMSKEFSDQAKLDYLRSVFGLSKTEAQKLLEA